MLKFLDGALLLAGDEEHSADGVWFDIEPHTVLDGKCLIRDVQSVTFRWVYVLPLKLRRVRGTSLEGWIRIVLSAHDMNSAIPLVRESLKLSSGR